MIIKYGGDNLILMKKTLVLVVDRDDDFGVKGGVDSPVIGIEACSIAATALGVADPEDSDVNALYAAMNIYKDLHSDRNNDVEVALICGNQKVGYRSDSAIVEELEDVLERTSPDRVILVGDGAEDEYVYPIVSSRIRIDSVRKVYVKQAPGIEGTIYILSKMLSDTDKRKRFLAPIGWIILLISLVYLVPHLMEIMAGNESMAVSTTPAVVCIIGFCFLLYAYNTQDWLSKWNKKWKDRLKSGSMSVAFAFIAIICIVAGVIYGFLSLDQVYMTRISQQAVWFVYSSLWFFVFGIMIYVIGDLLDDFLNSNTLKMSSLTSCVSLAALGLIAMGSLDIMLRYLDMPMVSATTCAIEIGFGLLLTFLTSLTQRHMKIEYRKNSSGTDEDAIQ
jgi:putative membrane protein